MSTGSTWIKVPVALYVDIYTSDSLESAVERNCKAMNRVGAYAAHCRGVLRQQLRATTWCSTVVQCVDTHCITWETTDCFEPQFDMSVTHTTVYSCCRLPLVLTQWARLTMSVQTNGYDS